MDQAVPVELASESHATIRTATKTLRDMADAARLTNDPLAPFIEALAVSTESQFRLYVDGTLTLNAAAERAGRLIDPEAVTEAVRKAFVRENGWQRQMAAEAARDAARKEWWHQVGIMAAVAAIAIALTGLVMTVWHDRRMDKVQDAQSALAHEAFSDGQNAGSNWTLLMAYNHVRDVLGARCKQVVVDGRRACDTRIWLDPPSQAGAQ